MHLFSVFSLRNRALIALLTIVVGIFGGIALTTLKQELIPDLDLPQLVISSSYSGASPKVVENDVSTPIERAIQGVEGLTSTTSTSTSGASIVSASFDYGTDITSEEQKVQLAIENIQSTLPSGVTPQVLAGSTADLPVIVIAVTSNLSQAQLDDQLNQSTIVDLEKLTGVRQAQLLGSSGQRVTITPNTDTLTKDGYTLQSIRTALASNGKLLASGSITENGSTLVVQSGTALTSTKEIAGLPLIGSRTTATIGDVATVKLTNNPVTGYSRVNGKPSLTISITKTPAGNTVAVSKEVRAALPGLASGLGNGTKFTPVFDQAPFIQQSINSLATEGLLGLGFAVIVILIFLLSIRSTLVTAISIPVSVLITFIGMLAAGYTLNLITLGALTIAIGRVVDDSIVVIENIKRHLGLGEDKLTAIKTAVREVATAVTASTVTTVAVFLPLAFVGGEIGELFSPFALTVAIALASSLFVALTIVPVLAYWFLPYRPAEHSAAAHSATADGEGQPVDELAHPTRLQRAYLPIIRGTLRLPLVTVAVALVILIATVFAARGLQTNYLGSSGQNTLSVSETLPAGTSLAAQDAASKKVESAIRGVRGVKTVSTTLGTSGGSLRAAFGGGGGTSFNITTNAKDDQAALQSRVRAAIKELDGVGSVEISTQSGFGSSQIEVDITAPTSAKLTAGTEKLLTKIKNLSAVAEADDNLAATEKYLSIDVNRTAAAADGLSELQVGQFVTAAMLPAASGTVTVNENDLSIYVTDPGAPKTIQALKDYKVPTAKGQVALSTIADVKTVKGPASVTTIRGVQSSTITVTPNTQNTGSASTAVQNAVNKVSLPAGVTATLGGVTSDQANAFGQLGLALLAAILIVYTVMVATFRSLRQPLILLISVPFAATGAILLQIASGIPLGVSSLIGVLMLVGIVVTNAIVLVDLINQYRARGVDTKQAIIQGAARRFRPIIMTALATIFALTPMATGLTGSGGFISQPLAIVVIGGLVSSTLLTLVVLPSLYWLVEGAKERRIARRELRATRPV